jgi:hypothetical protein
VTAPPFNSAWITAAVAVKKKKKRRESIAAGKPMAGLWEAPPDHHPPPSPYPFPQGLPLPGCVCSRTCRGCGVCAQDNKTVKVALDRAPQAQFWVLRRPCEPVRVVVPRFGASSPATGHAAPLNTVPLSSEKGSPSLREGVTCLDVYALSCVHRTITWMLCFRAEQVGDKKSLRRPFCMH